MKYTTQMNAARQGIVTKEMEAVAAYEGIDVKGLMAEVAAGTIVIPANKNHKCLKPFGIGNSLKTKINVNLGTSRDCLNLDVEMEKVNKAVEMGAEAIMDLSSFEWIDVFKMHAEDGVDFMTIHCGINRNTAERFKAMKRKMNIVSRGGSLIFAWMEATGNENPFFEYYDEILDICNEYDVTLSLGDACRPGCLADASDISQIEELVTLGELTARAWKKDVQVMIEGPGHMPMDQIQANMKIQQTICHGAPFYVLGPLVTDIAPGYDHITSAIGGAIAAASGASFLCYVTPAEHLRLPNVDDVKEGIMASKIAAHAADIAKGVKGAMDWDNQMAAARQKLDWEKQFELALDPEKARRYRAESTPEREDTCTMCGKMCSVRNMNAVLAGEDVDVI